MSTLLLKTYEYFRYIRILRACLKYVHSSQGSQIRVFSKNVGFRMLGFKSAINNNSPSRPMIMSFSRTNKIANGY